MLTTFPKWIIIIPVCCLAVTVWNGRVQCSRLPFQPYNQRLEPRVPQSAGLVLDCRQQLHGGRDGTSAAVYHRLQSAAARGLQGAVAPLPAHARPHLRQPAHSPHLVRLLIL